MINRSCLLNHFLVLLVGGMLPLVVGDLPAAEQSPMGVMLSLFMGVISVAFFKFGSVFGGIDRYSAG